MTHQQQADELGRLRIHAHNIIMNFLREQGFCRSEASRMAWKQVEDAPLNLLKRTLAGYSPAVQSRNLGQDPRVVSDRQS